MNKRSTGTFYEDIAEVFLKDKGFHVICRNYRCRFGEIDIIFRDGERFVFCEVKYRKDGRIQHPLDAVDLRKQRTIARCAYDYLHKRGLRDDVPCRFDVIAIEGKEIRHIPNAFEYKL